MREPSLSVTRETPPQGEDQSKTKPDRRFSSPNTRSHRPASSSTYTFSSVVKSRSNEVVKLRSRKVHEKRETRTKVHVENYIRLEVVIENDMRFSIVADRRQTIETLAQQIEAEYSYRFLMNRDKIVEITTVDGKKMNVDTSSLKMLECGPIYNDKLMEIRFSDLVGNVLSMDSEIKVVNLYEVMKETKAGSESEDVSYSANNLDSKNQELIRSSSAKSKRSASDIRHAMSSSDGINSKKFSSLQGIFTRKSADIVDSNTNLSTAEDQLLAILSNKASVESFLNFCIETHQAESLLFYMDIEMFQTCVSIPEKLALAFYIYQLYVCDDAPLKVNLTAEIKEDIALFSLQRSKLLDILMFDDAQQFIFALLKKLTFPSFTKTNEYTKLLSQLGPATPTSFFANFGLDLEFIQKSIVSMEQEIPTMNESHVSPEIRNNFKDLILQETVRRYFPQAKVDHISGYFDALAKLTRVHKMKLMDKERKITKFFGERPDIENLKQQSIRATNEDAEDELKSGVDGDALLVKVSSSEMPKRKTAKKLQDFFGDIEFAKELMADDTGDSQDGDYYDEEDDCENEGGSIHDLDSKPNSLINPKNKMEFTKRRNKLAEMMGEKISEEIVLNTRNLNASENGIGSEEESELSASEEESILNDEAENTREKKRKRFKKLQKYLGDTVTEKDFLESEDSAIREKSKITLAKIVQEDPEGKLAQVMRTKFAKRTDKLGKVFGQAVPQNILAQSGIHEKILQRHRNSIAGTLSVSDPVETPTTLVPLEVVKLVEKLPTEESKKHRVAQRKKMDKLRKILGESADMAAFENQYCVVSDIEKEIQKDMKDLEELQRSLVGIKQELRRRSTIAMSPTRITAEPSELVAVSEEAETTVQRVETVGVDESTKVEQSQESTPNEEEPVVRRRPQTEENPEKKENRFSRIKKRLSSNLSAASPNFIRDLLENDKDHTEF